MSYTRITEQNASNFPVGTKVRFFYGPLHGEENGVVTGIRTTKFGTELMARTETGDLKFISGISTVGVGVYLREAA